MYKQKETPLLDHVSPKLLANDFNQFFKQKVGQNATGF